MKRYLTAAAVAAGLFLAACGGPSTPSCSGNDYHMQCKGSQPAPSGVRAFSGTFGVDEYGGGNSPVALYNHGARFACSYLSGGGSKDWNRLQIDEYHQVGLPTCAVWETWGTEALAGYWQGVRDGRAALTEFRQIGGNIGRPIYFAVDTDTSAAAVTPYFRGVDAVLGRARVGVYGGYYVVAGLWNEGLVGYVWQTLAWSHGLWFSHACLRQTNINIPFAGFNVDPDTAVCADYGQFPYSPPPPPPSKAQIEAWQDGYDASVRAYDNRGCPVLEQRITWFSNALSRHPRVRVHYRRGALRASRTAYNHRACPVFADRVKHFATLLHAVHS